MSYDAININACSASCIFAHNWKGMSTNGGCRCLNNVNMDQRRQIQLAIKAYKQKLTELENIIADKVIEEELSEACEFKK